MVLSSCRSAGMEEGRIPWTACHQYAAFNGLTHTEERDLWEIVSALDLVYLKARADKAKKDRDNTKRPFWQRSRG